MPKSPCPVLGILTLGRSPREDVTPVFKSLLGPDVSLREAGGLDGLSERELGDLEPDRGESSIETRDARGRAVLLSRERLVPRVAAAFGRLAGECGRVLLLCSGEFPALASLCPGLIRPVFALRAIIGSLASNSILGVIGPESDLAEAPGLWEPYAAAVRTAPSSPYDRPSRVGEAARSLAESGAQVLLLDDMAFSEEDRHEAVQASSLPTLAASTLTARWLSEFYQTRTIRE